MREHIEKLLSIEAAYLDLEMLLGANVVDSLQNRITDWVNACINHGPISITDKEIEKQAIDDFYESQLSMLSELFDRIRVMYKSAVEDRNYTMQCCNNVIPDNLMFETIDIDKSVDPLNAFQQLMLNLSKLRAYRVAYDISKI